MVNSPRKKLRVGDQVRVPWGLQPAVTGEVVEVWGDPPRQIRVRLDLPNPLDGSPVILLLSPDVVKAA